MSSALWAGRAGFAGVDLRGIGRCELRRVERTERIGHGVERIERIGHGVERVEHSLEPS